MGAYARGDLPPGAEGVPTERGQVDVAHAHCHHPGVPAMPGHPSTRTQSHPQAVWQHPTPLTEGCVGTTGASKLRGPVHPALQVPYQTADCPAEQAWGSQVEQ